MGQDSEAQMATSWLSLPTFVGVAFSGMAIVLGLWGFSRPVLASHQIMILRASFAIASGIAAGAFTGAITADSRKILGVTATGGFALWFLTYLFFPVPDGKLPATICFNLSGQPVLKDMVGLVRFGDENPTIQIRNGQATVSVPAGTVKFDSIVLNDPEYTPYSQGPFPITASRTVDVAVTKKQAPPLDADEFPDPNPELNKISEKLSSPPRRAVQAEDVELIYRNETSRDLNLIILDCSAYLSSGRTTGWKHFPLSPSANFQIYKRFVEGSGWYLFYSLERSTGKKSFLGAKDLFQKAKNKLVIKESPGGLVAVFE